MTDDTKNEKQSNPIPVNKQHQQPRSSDATGSSSTTARPPFPQSHMTFDHADAETPERSNLTNKKK